MDHEEQHRLTAVTAAPMVAATPMVATAASRGFRSALVDGFPAHLTTTINLPRPVSKGPSDPRN